jgi:hypothetical protein
VDTTVIDPSWVRRSDQVRNEREKRGRREGEEKEMRGKRDGEERRGGEREKIRKREGEEKEMRGSIPERPLCQHRVLRYNV